MIAVLTKKGGFLVFVNAFYACYIDSEGTFQRSVDKLEEEKTWAKEKWQSYKEKELSTDIAAMLEKQLQHIQQYKDSLLVAVED